MRKAMVYASDLVLPSTPNVKWDPSYEGFSSS